MPVRGVCSSCEEWVELDLVVIGSDEDDPMLVTGMCLACGRLVQGYPPDALTLGCMIAAGIPTVAVEAHQYLEKASAS